MEETEPSVEAYEAAMVLSGVGDALGYRGGRWEYCTSGPQIHAELAELGGLEAITLEPPEWPVSDDTVLHLATAEGLATGLEGEPLLQELARRYVAAMGDMEGRKPGPTSILGTSQLRPGEPEGYRIPFNPSGTGCGAAMRSLAIGLRYPHAWELPTLIRVSIESGRMTHHHPTGTWNPGGCWRVVARHRCHPFCHQPSGTQHTWAGHWRGGLGAVAMTHPWWPWRPCWQLADAGGTCVPGGCCTVGTMTRRGPSPLGAGGCGGGWRPSPLGCTAASSTAGGCGMLPTASTRWPGGDTEPLPCPWCHQLSPSS
ncbi:ADP-ribosylhydrolase ARH1-like isoform X3 [Strix aluco]|uniref:ADP-ribosylhydrolase ARH1-like isoform X3 n=1 Tax=Strix aluco TaxID=111821 RepID=UPI003DA6418B